MPPAAEEATVRNRQRSVSQRASILVAISGPYRDRISSELRNRPFGKLMAAGAVSSFRMAMTAAPMQAVERQLNAGGPASTREEAARRRRVKLAGSAATVTAGVLAQRALTHSGRTGPMVEVGRILGNQLAIGGVANALVLAADATMRTDEAIQLSRGRGAPVVTAAVVLTQRRVLRAAASRLTLPTAPATATLAVQGRWRTRSVALPLR
jgi:hypothetical protein